MFLLMYLRSGASKNYEIYMRSTRLLYLSFASGITSLSVLICEIQLMQLEVSALSGTQDRFCLALFLTKLMSESVKVFHIKFVDAFLSFSTVYGTPLLGI